MKVIGLPPSIRVGPHDIKIRLVSEKELGDDFGIFQNDRLEITLCEEYAAGSLAVDTALHEILHAIWLVSMRESSGTEEQVCSTIASQLTQVLRDNPELVKWIQKSVAMC
jgi:hypothetical protein